MSVGGGWDSGGHDLEAVAIPGETMVNVPGSMEWLGEMVKVAMTSTDAARRRFWGITDEVARLRRDLSAAEERLATAEREYHAEGKLLHEIWDQTRAELEKGRSVETTAAILRTEPSAIVAPVISRVTRK